MISKQRGISLEKVFKGWAWKLELNK
jgi:hypothetical protein